MVVFLNPVGVYFLLEISTLKAFPTGHVEKCQAMGLSQGEEIRLKLWALQRRREIVPAFGDVGQVTPPAWPREGLQESCTSQEVKEVDIICGSYMKPLDVS
jgi:hypothetical protein